MFAVQLSSGSPPSRGGELAVMLLAIGCLLVAGVLVAIIRIRRRRRPRRPDASEEWRARGIMEELCPHGWQAQLTVYGWGAPAPEDAPRSRTPLVSLDWTEYTEGERVAVVRRVWAPSISAALQAMVDDRRTDMALEEIERAAGEAA